MLHDIDTITEDNKEQARENVKNTFPGSVLIYDYALENMLTYIIPLEGAEIRNIKRRTTERSLVIGYEVFRDD